MNNPLLDFDFLEKLHNNRQRETYARITLLNQNELPIQNIEGKITAGTVMVDGNSALRRTCNLTMVLYDQSQINEFNWTFKSKFKLEVGLKNIINPTYDDIIWFPQGMFILTSCKINQTTNNYTITIDGKDKMCKLNGDLGGSINAQTDFDIIEEVDKNGNITKIKLPLKTIIREMLINYGELPENIIINDLDSDGLELLEYRYEKKPLYLFKDENENVNQVTLKGDMKVKKVENDKQVSLADSQEIKYDPGVYVDGTTANDSTKIYFDDNKAVEYTVMKYEYGDLAGYRPTDLIYPGELKVNVGETVVSVLDKIKNILGHFEYFYNIDGRFVFQKKPSYVSLPWGGAEMGQEVDAADKYNADANPIINLNDAKLTTSFANNPNLLNVKNDFTVWGTYKSISGVDMPIHMRYAIDKKPNSYISFRNENIVEYTVEDWDWRELIYQMALDYYACRTEDDFYQKLMIYNPWTAPTGRTGYEQYYTDLQGFWRLLYNPESGEDDFYPAGEQHQHWNKMVFEHPNQLIFWFDFLDAEGSELYDNYSVRSIGNRAKSINDSNVKNMYYKEIPNILFTNEANDGDNTSFGYTRIQVPFAYNSLFNISTKNKTAKERIDELIEEHSYCIEATTITTVPLYHLGVNSKIRIVDEKSNISGEYAISKITVPLTYNGTMSLSANKSISSIK